jgi:hypothetical protein
VITVRRLLPWPLSDLRRRGFRFLSLSKGKHDVVVTSSRLVRTEDCYSQHQF